MKMGWIYQSSAALATLLIPVRMESRNCVPVLCRTTEGDPKFPVPIKIRMFPLPRVSPHCPSWHGACRVEGRMCSLPSSHLSPSLRAICRAGAGFWLSFILIEIPLGFLPLFQPAHTLLPSQEQGWLSSREAPGNPGASWIFWGISTTPHASPRGKKIPKVGIRSWRKNWGRWAEALLGSI